MADARPAQSLLALPARGRRPATPRARVVGRDSLEELIGTARPGAVTGSLAALVVGTHKLSSPSEPGRRVQEHLQRQR